MSTGGLNHGKEQFGYNVNISEQRIMAYCVLQILLVSVNPKHTSPELGILTLQCSY